MRCTLSSARCLVVVLSVPLVLVGRDRGADVVFRAAVREDDDVGRLPVSVVVCHRPLDVDHHAVLHFLDHLSVDGGPELD